MEIKPYQPGDEQAIIELFGQSFGKPMTTDFWQWRYAQNPFTSTPMINLMWDGNILAGHYAVFPVELVIGDRTALSALSMTTMTHPDYAGKGIFTTLAEDLYHRIHTQHHVEAVWGFPNLNSHYGFIKNLAWHDVTALYTLRLKKQKLADVKPAAYKTGAYFTEAHANSIHQNRKAAIAVNKTAAYLNWRYTQNPVNQYHIIELAETDELQFVVCKVFHSFEVQGALEIDILEHGYSGDPKTVSAMIGAITAFAKNEGLDIHAINTWMSVHDPRHLQLEKNRFAPDAPITFMGCRPLHHHLQDLTRFSAWDITMGDSDVY